jgi:hypothetical protein
MSAWSMSCPAGFTSGKETWCQMYRRLRGPRGQSGEARKSSPSPEFDPRTVQLTALHCKKAQVWNCSVGSTSFVCDCDHGFSCLYYTLVSYVKLFNHSQNTTLTIFFYTEPICTPASTLVESNGRNGIAVIALISQLNAQVQLNICIVY